MSIPQPTLIYRITHIQNVAWLLTNGLHCASSGILDRTLFRSGTLI